MSSIAKTNRTRITLGVLISILVPLWTLDAAARTIFADVVAIQQVITFNRLGSFNPGGMMYALRSDVVDANGTPLTEGGLATPGSVSLREDKRPRPIVLRMNVGDTLQIRFQNLLARAPRDLNDEPSSRSASIHVEGLHVVDSIASDGTNVGRNPSGLVAPGNSTTYTLYADHEGTFLLNSYGAVSGGEGEGGTNSQGLFGAVNVLPRGAEWYRSQVTELDLRLATTGHTADGHPIIDYDAVYPRRAPFIRQGKAGRPILKMLNDRLHIVHTDLTAIITGPNRGNFPAGTYREVEVNAPRAADQPRSRNEPFREFTAIFHDEVQLIDPFPEFNDPQLAYTLHSVRDGFMINYGSGGIGPEILANRKGVGPMWACTECKFEEFFLESWTVGDPAMVVDIPANLPDLNGNTVGPKATKDLYPDDPSNVYHSYIGDHVKVRNLHIGKEHHIFHLHTHQWLYTPGDDNSTYLDSQAIGPGIGYTYEIAYNGSGNRNQVVGDAIFHCHFYPHFAEGMWAIWRNHDVLEAGTRTITDPTDGFPVVAPGARALPDGEIAAGTPIPAIVPIPTRPMPPMPGDVQIAVKPGLPGGQIEITEPTDPATGLYARNPGYPFFMPAVAGHRNAQPPLTFTNDTTPGFEGKGFQGFDGGLPRHIITGGESEHFETYLSFDKTTLKASAIEIPLDGTPAEKTAMSYHSARFHDTFFPDGSPAVGNEGFRTNGRPPQPGAPYADPCVDDFGQPAGNQRVYKAAAIQLDIIMNKVGWHFPQSRILALWDDVRPTLRGRRPPEPFFFRANSQDCITYYHTNLLPNVYEMDDFQVRTPTDIIGQHIHLVKFDVTSSDGSGNGFNYENGAFSPQEVQERINAINAGPDGGLLQPYTGDPPKVLQALPHPGPFPANLALGAQAQIERWYADPVRNNRGADRTLRTVFTHDHFGPSTHQQAGLYAALVIEPKNSQWRDPENGTALGTRDDGGPTSWRADILTPNTDESYREFLLAFADFQPAYAANSNLTPVTDPVSGRVAGHADPAAAVNMAGRDAEFPLPFLFDRPIICPNGTDPPCPEGIMTQDEGTFVVNYRNEPIPFRIMDNSDPGFPVQAAGQAGDLAYVYRSDVQRFMSEVNIQPKFYPPLTRGVQPGDPFTPLLRAYQGDNIQIRTIVGATEEGHNATIHGVRWKQELSSPNSGYRNTQMMGISEHFEFAAPLVPRENVRGPWTDHLYQMGASLDDQWPGGWGLLRAYDRDRKAPGLLPLPNNPLGPSDVVNLANFRGICPKSAPVRRYSVTAVSASKALPDQGGTLGRTLVYNDRRGAFAGSPGPLHDPTAILYVRTRDLNPDGTLKAGVPIEPLVLRAAAGECVEVTLKNQLVLDANGNPPDADGFASFQFQVENFNVNQVHPSGRVGLHPQLVSYDTSQYDGTNVGLNRTEQTVAPGETIRYRWYAGVVEQVGRRLVATPVEFGASNLMPADPMKQASKGAFGALIIEPEGSSWVEDADSRASATVTTARGNSFREFVLFFQDAVNLMDGNGNPLPHSEAEEDSEDTGAEGFNYRTEPLWFRLGYSRAIQGIGNETNLIDFTSALSNTLTGSDPVTPVFKVKAGRAFRIRVLHPGGKARNHVFALSGHNWAREPYARNSTVIVRNKKNAEWQGAWEGIGPSSHIDVVPGAPAGGKFRVPGDYLYRDVSPFQFMGGTWGILRVE